MKTVVAVVALVIGCTQPAKVMPQQVSVDAVGAMDGGVASADAGMTDAKRAPAAACEAEVRELSTWADSLLAEGEFEANVSRGKDFYAKTAAAPGWLSSGFYVELTNDLLIANGSFVAGATTPRTTAEANLRAKLADYHAFRKTMGNTTALPVALIVRRDTSWSRIAETTELLESAGERSVAFVVEARESSIAPPPHSALTDTAVRFARGEVPLSGALMKQRLEQRVLPETERCPEARALSDEIGERQIMTPRAKAELFLRELPRRIAACDCAVDMDGVRTRLWAAMKRFEAHPVAEIPLALAKSGTVLKANPADTWQDNVERVRVASVAGKPVRLVAQ